MCIAVGLDASSSQKESFLNNKRTHFLKFTRAAPTEIFAPPQFSFYKWRQALTLFDNFFSFP